MSATSHAPSPSPSPSADTDTGSTTAEVIVLGLGPGGEAVANELADAGVDVVGIDERLVGGECAYWACVPSKAMVHAGVLVSTCARIDEGAGTAAVEPRWSKVADRIRQLTSGWDDHEAVQAFVERGGRFVRGRGRLVGPRSVEVDGTVFEATRGIVLATGTAPLLPPIDGLDGTPFWTNREAVEATEPPDRMVVIGAGPVGCELSQVFARYGTEVTMVESSDRIHGVAEPEASDILRGALERDGITILTGCQAKRVSHDGSFSIELDDGRTLSADRLLVVVGRDPHLDRLGVDAIGVDPSAGALEVDDRQRVTDGVWAVGDVTGGPQFTHVATNEARCVVAQLLGEPGSPVARHAIPYVTFTDPELAAVGMTEQQAVDAGLRVATGATDGGARAWIVDRIDDTLVKVVADADRGILVGATAVGPAGGEVLGLLVLAVHARIPVAELRSLIYAYPTYHRAVEGAVSQLDL